MDDCELYIRRIVDDLAVESDLLSIIAVAVRGKHGKGNRAEQYTSHAIGKQRKCHRNTNTLCLVRSLVIRCQVGSSAVL